MYQRDSIKVFDWHRMFYSENVPITYLGEIGFRTVVMFVVLIFALKLLSKRGVKQLSVFELAILIALGYYKTKACSTCPVKDLCTKNQEGRLIERS